MVEINLELYELLKDVETHIYREDNEISTIALVDFWKLKEFQECVGSYYFDEGGCEVKLLEGYIGIELNDIFEGQGNNISDYKRCFEESEYNEFKEEIEKMEG